MKNSIFITVQGKKSQTELDYHLSGISNEEYKHLIQKCKSVDYSNYEGVFSPYNVWRNLEVIFYIGDKFDAKELVEFKEKFHDPCTETTPYQLSDGRILVLGAMHAHFYENETDYLNQMK